jgi:HSP20 family molecular chaperone IbpA
MRTYFDDIFDMFGEIQTVIDAIDNGKIDYTAPRFRKQLVASDFPPSNVIGTKDRHFIIEIALAGVKEEDIKLDLEGRHLVLKVEQKLDDRPALFAQRGIKGFTKIKNTYLIPNEYDVSTLAAKYENGMLYVDVGPTPETKQLDEKRTIAIGAKAETPAIEDNAGKSE